MKKKGVLWKRHLAALLSGLIITGAASGLLTTAAYAAETADGDQTEETISTVLTEEEGKDQGTGTDQGTGKDQGTGTDQGSGTGESAVSRPGYEFTETEDGITCVLEGEAIRDTFLAVTVTDGVYTAAEPGTAGSILYRFDAEGNGKTYTGVYEGRYYKKGVPGTKGYIRFEKYVYAVSADGSASLDVTGNGGTHRRLISGKCYSVDDQSAKASAFTGVYAKKYYKKGKLATAQKTYYVIYKNCVYKVTKTGAAAKDTSSKSGTHQRLISGKCYKVSNKTAKYALFTGMYSKKCYTKGKLTSGWQKIGKKKYYCKKGVPVTGRKKISKKWYYFKVSGALAVKDTTENNITYYLDADLYLDAYKKNGVYYKANGTALTSNQTNQYIVLLKARKIAAKITTSKMTKAQKLKTCFDYVKKAYRESSPRTPHYLGADWPVIYANDMFVRGTGNCCSYAAAFAFLAKAIGYDNVYAVNSGGHGWTEINGLLYDPERSIHVHTYSYYGMSYTGPIDVNYKAAFNPNVSWMHVKIGF